MNQISDENQLSEKDKTKLDVAKIHNEINQFRNQEFWVCSFAIALFGATVKFLPGKPLLSFGVIVVLGGLYLWHYTLAATRARLTTYLQVKHLSIWEIEYREFADKLHRPSQGTAAFITFFLLGVMVPVIAGWDYVHGGFVEKTLGPKDLLLWLYLAPLVLYIVAVVAFGLTNSTDKLSRYEHEWRRIIKKTP